MILLIIEIALLCLVGFPILYLALLSIIALFARERTDFPAERQRRFAVVVPAHDEELSIERTLRSLFHSDYPSEAFEIVVVADNCSDRTAALARSLGATVLERKHPTQRSKGYALRWCFEQLLDRTPGYDAFVIIDADSVVAENYLTVLNYYLENGAQAIQCSDMAAPQPDSWSTEMTRLGLTLYNYVRPIARMQFGGSAGIRGNGMCFASSTLRAIPWSTYSLNEDLEYGLILLLNGMKVLFAPEAKVYAAMPAQAEHAQSQRERWESGRFPVIRNYSGRLLLTALQRLSFPVLDAWIDLMTPAFVNLFGISALLSGGHIILWLFGWNNVMVYAVLWAGVLAAGLAHVVIGLVAAHADAALYRAFVYIPRYVFWKLLLYSKLIRRGTQRDWVRTTRDESLPTENR